MGIQNKDGALYFATGIDNTGLYSGRKEAMGIIKAMASEITSFDVFGGIGISAGIAFAKAAKGAYDFEKQFQQSMKEVATLSNGIKGSLTDYMNQVIDLTRNVPIQANDAAKALYQIVSAGHDGADGMKVLEVSAKAAVGGVTDTATAADGITTLLNAYKLDVSEAEKISDQLFTTVKLGKTSFGELGKSIAQVAPIAAAYGVETDQVLAAVATLTKQGTPTAQAMTQIRASIIAASKVLGDGAFEGRTYQEALAEVAKRAGGSESKLRELVPEVEAVNAVLGLTGINVKEAAGHLEEMQNATGAAEEAFKEMASSAEKQLKLLSNNITAFLRPMGEAVLREVSSVASAFNKAFDNGDVQASLKTLGDLIVIVTTALVGYKGSIIAVNAIKKIHISLLEMAKYEMALYRKAVETGAISEKVLTSAQVKQMATRKAMITTVKLHTTALKRNIAALATNPYILAAAAVAGLGYAIYKYATAETEAEKAQKRLNNIIKESQQRAEDYKNKIQDLVSVARNEAEATFERHKALIQLKRLMPSLFKEMDLQKLKTMDQLELTNKIAEAEARRNVIIAKTNLVMAKQRLQKIDNQIILTNNRSGYTGAIKKDREAVAKEVDMLQDEVDKAVKTHTESIKAQVQSQKEAAIQNKAYWTKQKEEATKALESIASAQKKQMDAGNFKGIDSSVVASYKESVKKLKEAEKELTIYDIYSKQNDEALKLRKEQERYNLLLNKQKREQKRMTEDSANELEQLEINKLKESSEKILRQRELNHMLELQAIDREAEDKKLKEIDNARSAFETNPENKKKVFNVDKFVKEEPTKKLFASFDKAANEKKETTNIKYNRGDDLAGLLSEYQEYTDKRLAIERKFNEDIATLQGLRKQAAKNGDTEQVSKIDRSIAKAIADKGKELMKHDFDVLKQSPEYIRAFEDLRNTSSETLKSLLEQLEKAKGTAATVLNPEDLREYTTTIQEIMDELDARNPFKALIDRQKELAESEQELADAKKQLDDVNAGKKIITGVKSHIGSDGKINAENTYLSAEAALNKYNIAKDKAQKANNNFIKAEQIAKEKVNELANAMIGIGESIGGTSGEIISLVGDIALFTTGTIESISKVAKTGAEAMSAVEKASVILGIVSAGIQLMQQLNSILPTADNQYEKYAEKISEINKLTNAVNEYRIAALKAQQAENNWFSVDNLKNLRDYKNLHDEVAKAYKDKAKESQAIYQNKSGGGWFTNSWNWLLDNTYGKIYGIDFGRKYKEGQTEAINNLRIETRSRKKGFLGSGIGGRSQKTEDLVSWARNNGFGELFDNEELINKDAANAILNQYGDKLVGQTKETLESLVQLREKYDEYIQQLHEYVSSLYEPLVDNFVNSLWDWLDTGKDALDSFKDYASDTFRDIVSDMLRTIVLEKVVGSFSDDIAALYEEYAKGAINETELMKRVAERTSGLVNNYEQNIPTLQNILKQVDGYLKSAGIDLEQSGSNSQSSTSKGFQAMSQDTGEELSGRFTALLIAGELSKEQLVIQTGIQQVIAQRLEYIFNFNYSSMTEMRDIFFDVMDILSEMKKDTSHLYFIRESLSKIDNNTKGLSNK